MAFDVAVQPDGKIVAGGWAQEPGAATQSALARYQPDVTLDASFDGDGRLTPAASIGTRRQASRRSAAAGAAKEADRGKPWLAPWRCPSHSNEGRRC